MYQEKTSDRIMIPQWEYRKLRDVATRVDVVLDLMAADKYMSIDDVKRILAPHKSVEYTTADDLATVDPMGYTE